MPLSVRIGRISAQRRQTPTLRIRWHLSFSWLPACLMCWMALLFYVVQKWQMLWHLSDLVQCRKWNFWKEAAFLRIHFVVCLWHFFHPKKLLLIFEFDVSWGPAFPIQPECLEHAFSHFFHVIISLTAKWLVDGWRYCTGMLEWFYHQNNFSCRGIPSWYFLPRPRLWFSSAACGGRSVVSSLHPALPFALRCRWVWAAGWDNEFISCRQPSSCHITMPFSHYWQRQDLKQWRRSKRPCNPETSAGQQLGRLLTCTSTSSLQGLCFSCHQEMSLSYLVVGILQRQWELLGVPAERSVSALCVTVSAVCLLTSALTDGSLATSALGSVRPCAGLGGCFVLHSFLLLLEFHFICFLSAKIWIQT